MLDSCGIASFRVSVFVLAWWYCEGGRSDVHYGSRRKESGRIGR